MADASKVLDAAMIGVALLPQRFLSLTPMKSFTEKENPELRKYVHDSAVRRLAASWITWIVAVFYIGLEAKSFGKMIGLEFGLVMFFGLAVCVIYQLYSLPKNKAAGVTFPFLAAPLGVWRLLPRPLRWSPFNMLVFIGIGADASVVLIKILQLA